jgi:hypothetical protein
VAWLVDLVPELARSGEVPPTPALDPDRARVALQHAVIHVLASAAADRPLLVVLDDVHDADAASLALAILVCRSLADSALLVVTTQRPVGPSGEAASPDLLGQLGRQGTLVPVGALNQAAVAEQAAALAGSRLAPEEAAWLHRASGGNPLFVEQLVRWSAMRPGVGVPGELPVSATVRRVVGERLAELGGDARRVVTVAAVAGDEIGQDLLATVAGLPPGRFADAVAEAVGVGILWRRASEHPTCGFVHALLREAAYAEIAAQVRRGLHLELAAALEVLPGGPGRLAEVAHHRRAALPAGDPQLVVDRTVAAAEAALRVFAHEAAAAQCTAGLTAIGPYGSQSAARRWQACLLKAFGQAQLQAGDPVRARQTLRDAYDLASGVGEAVLAADAVARMPRLTQFLVPDRELEAVLTAALAALGDAAPALRVRLLARRAVIAEVTQDRRTHSDQAVQAARELGDEALLAEVLSAWLYVLWAPDTAQERLVTSSEIIDLGVRIGDVRRELDGRMWRLIALLEFGRVAEAEAELGRYERLAERLGQPEFLFFARSRRATLATLRGRFDEAERLTRTAYDLAVTAGLPDALNVLVGQLGTIAMMRGTAAMEALATEEWLGERLRAFGGPPLLIRAHGLLAAGRREEAGDLFRAGLSAADFPPPSRCVQLVNELSVSEQKRSNPGILAEANYLLLPAAGCAHLYLVAKRSITDSHPDTRRLASALPAMIGHAFKTPLRKHDAKASPDSRMGCMVVSLMSHRERVKCEATS